MGHGHVVQEEQRFGTAAQGIVDAHGHQVDSHRLVPPRGGRDLQFRSHAVSAGDEDGIVIFARE